MSVTVCCHIYNFGFVYENINIFLSNDHIWNYRNLNSLISETQLDIVLKFSGFSSLSNYCQMIEDFESRNRKGSKICIFESRPIIVASKICFIFILAETRLQYTQNCI